jgi:hypothetical protein
MTRASAVLEPGVPVTLAPAGNILPGREPTGSAAA